MKCSPKGKYRMWHFAVIGAVFLGFAAMNPISAQYAWLWETVQTIGKAGAGLAIMYWAGRAFLHTRTHELPKEEQWKRENILLLGLSLVVASSLL